MPEDSFPLGAPGPDGGPVYRETDLTRLIVEPFNGASAAIFLIIAVYWLWRLRGQWGERRFLVACLFILAVGGMGGTIFHAFRIHRIFLFLDVLPILILTLAVSVRFWLALRAPRWMIPLGILPFLLGRFLFLANVPRHTAISASYAMTALLVLLPLLVYLRRDGYRGAWMIALAVGLFVPALAFRDMDSQRMALFPMGTHWLWHCFSAASVFLLIRYLEGREPEAVCLYPG